ncbi:MAG: hypothetical protein MUO31_00260 [Thermodesulfovibrionales bacterium]|nr:hypothetical protein [Thermodesulfovibrionales bacterium]
MDLEFFLKSRTAFIRYFYENGVRPFNDIKMKIETGEEPYIPTYSEDGESPFLEDWMDAEQGVEIVGYTCISMLSSSLHLFLKSWVNLFEKAHGVKLKANFKKRGWFDGYKKIFNELELSLSQCGANIDIVEQITLARNRVQHPEELTEIAVDHSECDLKRFAKPFFASEKELKMAIQDADSSTAWWFRPSVKSAKDKVFVAIEHVEILCSWLEKKR